MANTAIARVPLGSSTNQRKWFLDVDTNVSGTGTPTWVGVFGITELTVPGIDSNLEDDTDYDGGGFGSKTKTGESWTIEGSLARKVQAAVATAYDPGQEFLRGRALGKQGAANSVHVRAYEMTPGGPRVEAYEGRGAMEWNPKGGKPTDLSTVDFKIHGQGPLNAITHPDTP